MSTARLSSAITVSAGLPSAVAEFVSSTMRLARSASVCAASMTYVPTCRPGFYMSANRRPVSPVTVVLACGCLYTIPPFRSRYAIVQPGQEIYCFRHMVKTHRPMEELGYWHWLCVTNYRCGGQSRNTGLSNALCVERASAHTRKYPQHEVWVIQPDGIVSERWYPNGDALFGVQF